MYLTASLSLVTSSIQLHSHTIFVISVYFVLIKECIIYYTQFILDLYRYVGLI